MRRRAKSLALAPAVAALLLLTACGGNGDDEGGGNDEPPQSEEGEQTEQPEATGTIDDVTVEGDVGEAPTISLPDDFYVAETESKVLDTGEGDELTEGQNVTVDYVGVVGRNGEEFDSSWTNGQVGMFPLAQGGLIPGFLDGLLGKNVGDRVLITIPSDDGYPEGSGEVIQPGDTLVFVVEIHETYGNQASGEEVPAEDGLPVVEVDDEGAVTGVDIPEGDPPQDLVVQPLIVGDGPEVEVDSTTTFQLHAVNWRNGEVVDSSWIQGQPYTVPGFEELPIEGLTEGVVGQPVGSRMLLVLPPEFGFGEEIPGENPDEPLASADDTIVMVVDILQIAS